MTSAQVLKKHGKMLLEKIPLKTTKAVLQFKVDDKIIIFKYKKTFAKRISNELKKRSDLLVTDHQRVGCYFKSVTVTHVSDY